MKQFILLSLSFAFFLAGCNNEISGVEEDLNLSEDNLSEVSLSSNSQISSKIQLSYQESFSSTERSSMLGSSKTQFSSIENLSSQVNSSLVVSSSELPFSSSVELSSSSHVLTTGTFTDPRDNDEYNWTQLGTQIWMAENLTFDGGTSCVGGSGYCVGKYPNNKGFYQNNTGDPGKYDNTNYGRLYLWTTAMDGEVSSNKVPSGVQGLCPTGWHLPSDAEWEILAEFIANHSGKTSKTDDDWDFVADLLDEPFDSAIYRFDAKLAGEYENPAFVTNTEWSYFNIRGYFWSSTSDNTDKAWSRLIVKNNPTFIRRELGTKLSSKWVSIRCVKD